MSSVRSPPGHGSSRYSSTSPTWPNLVSRAEDADLVVVSGADFGRWCTAALQISRLYTQRTGHHQMPSVRRASDFEALLQGEARSGAR